MSNSTIIIAVIVFSLGIPLMYKIVPPIRDYFITNPLQLFVILAIASVICMCYLLARKYLENKKSV